MTLRKTWWKRNKAQARKTIENNLINWEKKIKYWKGKKVNGTKNKHARKEESRREYSNNKNEDKTYVKQEFF